MEATFTEYKCKHKKILDLYNDEFDHFFESNTMNKLVTIIDDSNEEEFTDKFDMRDLNCNILVVPYLTLRDISFRFLRRVKPAEISSNKLNKLTISILRKYNYVPYHNFAHGFSVMQFFNEFVERVSKKHNIFDKLHVFVCLLACLAHDVGHQAKNNPYQVNRQSRKAVKAFNTSVLEKYHAGTLLLMINDEKSNIFENLTPEEKLNSRKTILEVIMSTDMAIHFDLLKQFNSLNLSDLGRNDNMVCGYVAHCGDLGNVCLDFDNYLSWAKLVSQEFHNQTISESKKGLKVTQFMVYHNFGSLLKDQISFAGSLTRYLRGSPVCIPRVQV
jgi:hypothetical protein